MRAQPSASPRRTPSRWLPAAFTALALLLTGCGSQDSSGFELVVIGNKDDPFQTGAELSLSAQLTRAATAQGLVAFDEQGRVVPALADRWIVTDDGQSYIFRLRDGDWRDGSPLTARSAKAALDAALRKVRTTPLGRDLAAVEEVRVMAGRVIEIRLMRPMPFFLQVLAQPELGLVHQKQGDGPMTLTRRGDQALFTPIEPSRLGLPEIPDWNARTRPVSLTALPAAAAVQRFNAGEVDLVLGGRIQDFPLTSSVGILRGTIQLDPVVGLFGLRIASGEGFLADPRNREALAMAVDRTALIAPFGVSGWTATTRVVSPGLQGDLDPSVERWQDVPIDQRRAVARARVAQWRGVPGEQPAAPGSPPARRLATGRANPGASASASSQPAPGPERPATAGGAALVLTIWLPPGPGSDILLTRLGEDFRAIGVDLRRIQEADAADLRLVDDVARYPRVSWFLNRLACTPDAGLCDKDADAIIASAARVTDGAQRAALLAQAEARLTEANVFIPFGTPIRWSLVRGNVEGFATNTWGWHPLMPLAWLHK